MRVASSRDRLLAALVDAAVVIVGMAVVIGLAIGGAIAYSRARGRDDEPEADEDDDEDEEEEHLYPFGVRGDTDVDDQDDRSLGVWRRTQEFLQAPLPRSALSGASAGLAVANRNWRSPGFRVVGLYRVDARTGGPIGVRSVLIGVLFDQAQRAVTKPLFRSRVDRRQRRIDELAPQLEEIKHKHAANPEARQRALTELYKANAVNPFAGCGWQAAGPILSQLLLAMAIRNGRTVYDRLTGTIVVRDR